jgi:peptide chain release factor 2
MVNDHRTELKIPDIQKVMDGALDPFIEAFLKKSGNMPVNNGSSE